MAWFNLIKLSLTTVKTAVVVALAGGGGLQGSFLAGQVQRVAIPRYMANRPSPILADEPTTALESVRGRQRMELFRTKVANVRQAGVIVVTHDQRALDVFDRSLEADDGRTILKE